MTTPDIPTYGLFSRLADGKGYHTTKIPLVEREVVVPEPFSQNGSPGFFGHEKSRELNARPAVTRLHPNQYLKIDTSNNFRD